MNTEAARLIALELQLELSSSASALYFHGESMRPFLGEGDEVVVEPVSWGELEIGDVITYRFENKFPTRRVVRKSRAGLLLWCDNWPREQFYCQRNDVLGRAVARRRDGSWITRDHPEWTAARRAALAMYRELFPRSAIAFVRRAAAKIARTLRPKPRSIP